MPQHISGTPKPCASNSLDCLKGAYVGVHMQEFILGSIIKVIKGDTGSLDYSSCVPV